MASVGAAQNVLMGAVVTLDGTASSDANNDSLTYVWTLTGRPNGSAAELAAATSARPTLTPDVAGGYVASLVVNDGKVNSAAATVSIMATAPPPPPNTAPVANAGTAQNVAPGVVVTLNGTGSSDVNGDLLTYSWTLTSKPQGSTAVLGAANTARPMFTADLAGSYEATLVVNDGKTNSTTATVAVVATVANSAPVANPGPGQNVIAGAPVSLNGSASSDVNGDPLSYLWTLEKPSGSNAVLTAANTATPSFVTDLVGFYVVTLHVNDGKGSSTSATVTIAATPAAQGNGTWTTTLKPRDFNGDGQIDAYYDTVLNLLWLANANAAAGTSFDTNSNLQGPLTTGTDGLLIWKDAKAWAAALNVHGVTGWRLPTMFTETGAAGTPPPPSTSEMAFMFYTTLGNTVSAPANRGPFVNLRSASYWTDTAYSNYLLDCWNFDFSSGIQRSSQCGLHFGYGNAFSAWAVRVGDVPAVVQTLAPKPN